MRGTVSNVSGGQVAIGGTVTQTSTTVSAQGPTEADIAALLQQSRRFVPRCWQTPRRRTRRPRSFVGAVTALVVNPIVGALVGAAGETLATEFKRRFN